MKKLKCLFIFLFLLTPLLGRSEGIEDEKLLLEEKMKEYQEISIELNTLINNKININHTTCTDQNDGELCRGFNTICCGGTCSCRAYDH